jgi:hypothetical protein
MYVAGRGSRRRGPRPALIKPCARLARGPRGVSVQPNLRDAASAHQRVRPRSGPADLTPATRTGARQAIIAAPTGAYAQVRIGHTAACRHTRSQGHRWSALTHTNAVPLMKLRWFGDVLSGISGRFLMMGWLRTLVEGRRQARASSFGLVQRKSSGEESINARNPGTDVLEEEPVSGVRMDLQLSVWDRGGQHLAVCYRQQLVLSAVSDQHGGRSH